MAINLVETVQKKLQYPELRKISPNTQEVSDKDTLSETALIAQAAIPAVLTGLFKHSRNDQAAKELMQVSGQSNKLALLFADKEEEVVKKVADYAGVSENQSKSHMENIADEAIKTINEIAGKKWDPHQLEVFMNDQRHNILVYLPAALKLGELLQDEALDDRTNKMEGPVSTFMHRIEDKMSQDQ